MDQEQYRWENITLIDKKNNERAIAQARRDAEIQSAIANRKPNETIADAIARERHYQYEDTRSDLQIKHDVLVQRLLWWATNPWGTLDDKLLQQLLSQQRRSKFWKKKDPTYIQEGNEYLPDKCPRMPSFT